MPVVVMERGLGASCCFAAYTGRVMGSVMFPQHLPAPPLAPVLLQSLQVTLLAGAALISAVNSLRN